MRRHSGKGHAAINVAIDAAARFWPRQLAGGLIRVNRHRRTPPVMPSPSRIPLPTRLGAF